MKWIWNNRILEHRPSKNYKVERVYTDVIHGQEVQVTRYAATKREEQETIPVEPNKQQSVLNSLILRMEDLL